MSQSAAPMVLKVNAIGPGLLLIEWLSGETLQTDISEQIKRFKLLHPLRDAERFAKVAPGLWGHSVTWGDDVDMGADMLYELGRQQGGIIRPTGFNPLLDIDPDQLRLDLEPGGRLHWADLGEDAKRALGIMENALVHWEQHKRPQPEPPFFYDYTPGTPEFEAAYTAYDAQLNAYWADPYYPAATDAAFCLYHGRSTTRQRLNDFKSMADAARYFAWPRKLDRAIGISDSAIYALLALIDANEAMGALIEVPRHCMAYLQEACGEDVDLSLLEPELEQQQREYGDWEAENRLYAVRLLATAKQYLMLAEWSGALGASPEQAKETLAANSMDAERGRKFPNGRRKGAISDITRYLQKIIAANPGKSAKVLYHNVAASDAESGLNDCPWNEYTDDVLHGAKGEMPFNRFEKRVAEIRAKEKKSEASHIDKKTKNSGLR